MNRKTATILSAAAGILLFGFVRADAEEAIPRTKVYIEERKGAPYPLMGNLIYQYKEQLRSSTRFAVVDDPTKAEIVTHITGVGLDDRGDSMSFAVAWTGLQRGTGTRTNLIFLHYTGGHVGMDRTKSIAESLAASTDEVLDSWHEYQRDAAQSAFNVICKEPIGKSSQVPCAELKARISKMP